MTVRDVRGARKVKSDELQARRQQGGNGQGNRFQGMGKNAILAEVHQLFKTRGISKPIFIQACNALSGKNLTTKEQGQLRGAINSMGNLRSAFLPIAQQNGLL